MPFKNNWHEFVLKNLLRKAAEGNYDKLSWVTGEQTAERYDLSKQVDALYYVKTKNGYKLKIIQKGESSEWRLSFRNFRR